jgi:hypothetical protein
MPTKRYDEVQVGDRIRGHVVQSVTHHNQPLRQDVTISFGLPLIPITGFKSHKIEVDD